ncbi:FAD-dependent monooxygenase [Arthrobacter sp. AZCC_0090]|uniref:FAD-dependent oxidoreductase n=1 Tax=Arthrobacter sp. AZCC_0090 TaxID=2735881 RepID=UPI00160A43B2|nr:FAD-dependent monooxygenase [Arthrobacter sp. AZCC_0090]MBB6407185.1 2,4-dichlorophenol 6-monooxygenase [Arthrobacter sp. AZCC_0090]
MIDFETDVFIVGSGPTGSAAALALATYGIRTHMVTRYRWLSNTPRAHITNQRTMEVLRDLGVDEEVERYGSEWDVMGDTLFATSLAGTEIARIRTWGTGDERFGDYLRGSPCTMLDVPQPYMESVLLRNAAERGAHLSLNTEYLSHEQDNDGVTVKLLDRLSGREYEVRAKYLIGADGARSQIAEEIGLEIEGHQGRANTAYVQFTADLSRYVAHRPSILHWIMSPSASYGEIGMGLLRAIRPWTKWIAGWGYDPAQGEPDFSPEAVIEKIRTLVGDPELEISIDATSTWLVNQAYATTYSVGRVFCGGDAVHRHPPSGGLGSNTCIQDAFNLAWKLAFVLKGDAGAALLDSYTHERMPVGRQIVERANKSRADFGLLNEAIRTEGAADPIAAAVAKLRDPSPEGVKTREAITKALAGKNYEFNAQGVEMNHRYVSAAVIPDCAEEEHWTRDPELFLQPSTRPGAKLPHAWLVNSQGVRTSTLDVIGHGLLTLVTGLGGQAWVKAVEALGHPFLRAVVIGDPGTEDAYGEWAAQRDMDEAGALLVRPDGYIAWRQREAMWNSDDAAAQLGTAIGTILHKGA